MPILFAEDQYTNCLGLPNVSRVLELQKYSKHTDYYRLFCFLTDSVLYVLKFLKLCLFCLPMLVDYCSHKLFAHKIPMHRKWVRLKCASHILHDALFMFQFLSFMRASLKSSCLARGVKRYRLLGDNPIFILTVFVCPHDDACVVIMFYSFCFNKVPSRAIGKTWVKSLWSCCKKQKL